MAELKIRKGSVTVELKDDNNNTWDYTWPDAVLESGKKLKVKYQGKEADLSPGQEADL